MNAIPLLRLINKQGTHGDSIIFKLPQAADIIGMSYDEILTEAKKDKISTKRFSNDPVQWRISSRAIVEYVDRTKIFTEDEDDPVT